MPRKRIRVGHGDAGSNQALIVLFALLTRPRSAGVRVVVSSVARVRTLLGGISLSVQPVMMRANKWINPRNDASRDCHPQLGTFSIREALTKHS